MQHVSFCVWFILLNTLSSPGNCRRHSFRAYWHPSNTITPHLRSGVSISGTVHEDICPLVDLASVHPSLVQTSKETRCTGTSLWERNHMKRQGTLRHQNERDDKSKSCEFMGKIDVWKLLSGRCWGCWVDTVGWPSFRRGAGLISNFCFTTRES